MSDHPHRARRSVARGTVSVAIVLALSGALFAANAKFAQASGGDRHPQDLDDLARVELGRVDTLTSEVDALHTDVDALAASANEASGTTVGTPSTAYLVESGELSRRRRARLEERVRAVVERRLQRLAWRSGRGEALLAESLPELERGDTSPYAVAERIVAELGVGG